MLIRTDRPRLWMTPDILTALRLKAQGTNPRTARLRALCEAYMGVALPYGGWEQNYSLAYLIFGDTRYADKAISLAMATVAQGMGALTVSGRHGYEVRDVLPRVCAVYDWCYDHLTDTQRTQIRTQLEAWADWVWPETNPIRDTGWSVHNPGDNFYHGFMMTWLVGIVLSGDSVKAQNYIDQARWRWINEARLFIEKYQRGGYLLEGTNYGPETMYRIFSYLYAHKIATGNADQYEDFLTTDPFFSEVVQLWHHMTTPDTNFLVPFGDQPRIANAPVSDSTRGAMLVAMNSSSSTLTGLAANVAKGWLDKINLKQNSWSWTAWQEVLFYREDLQAVSGLRKGYHAKGSGFISARTGWEKDATQLAFICGPGKESHQDRAAGSFMIFRGGEWMAGSARLVGGHGLLQKSEYHNTINLPPTGQSAFDASIPILVASQEAPKVTAFEDTEYYTYIRCEAPTAYDTWKWPTLTKSLSRFDREIFWIKPDIFVIRDFVNNTDPLAVVEKVWQLQCLSQPTAMSDGTYSMARGANQIIGKSIIPNVVTVAPVNEGPGGTTSSWRIEIRSPTLEPNPRFLQVLQLIPSVALGASVISLTENGIRVGDVDIWMNPEIPFVSPTVLPQRLFIFGLKPGGSYERVESNVSIPLTASDAGVLVVSGGSLVTIREASPDGPFDTTVTDLDPVVAKAGWAPADHVRIERIR